ncbi:MAG: hypothetical protein CM1200mP30_20350 [Pseudomonadota bacterium]|nr:MAG: hypothetical protein CM1200mP30_20350 [Pseudomonadota bacterium]
MHHLFGDLFSIGLGISGMTQPQKVIGFLDVFGEWDLSLAFVMFGAVLSYLILQLWIQETFPTCTGRILSNYHPQGS